MVFCFYMEPREPIEPKRVYSNDDLKPLALLLGENSSLFLLGMSRSPDFITELGKLLKSPEPIPALVKSVVDTEAAHPSVDPLILDDDGAQITDEARILSNPELFDQALDYVNWDHIALNQYHQHLLADLIELYERLSGKSLDW